MRRELLYLLTLIIAFGCGKNVTENVVTVENSNYYPVKVGTYRIYKMDSTVYSDLFADTIKTTYRLKEHLSEAFLDNSGQQIYRVMRYLQLANDSGTFNGQPWRFLESTTIKPNGDEIQIVEDNAVYLKLLFPLKVNKQWNGNIYNTKGVQTYTVSDIDISKQVMGQNVLTTKIIEQSQRSKLAVQEQWKRYAQNLGLVHFEQWNISSDRLDPVTEVEQRISKGFVLIGDLEEIGNE